MKNLKDFTLLFIALVFSTAGLSQELKSNSSQINPPIVDSFKVILTNDSLSITFQNKLLPISDLQQFDTFLKNNHPDLSQSQVYLKSPIGTKYERKKGLLDILTKYHNQVFSGINYN